jgi:hypothetical protein
MEEGKGSYLNGPVFINTHENTHEIEEGNTRQIEDRVNSIVI